MFVGSIYMTTIISYFHTSNINKMLKYMGTAFEG